MGKATKKKKYIVLTLETKLYFVADKPEELTELEGIIDKNREYGSCEIKDTTIEEHEGEPWEFS